jgi:phage tail-like protein
MAETEADKHIFVNNFKCDLSEDITKISSITMNIKKISTTTGNDVKEVTYRPGRPTFGNITFEGAEHPDGIKKIREWVKKAYDGEDARKDITIEIRNQASETVRTFNLFRCLPVAYSSIDLGSQGGAQTMHWVLEVRVQRLAMA